MEKLTKRDKIMLGVTVVSVAAAGYFGYKYIKTDNLCKIARELYAKESKERAKLSDKCDSLFDEISTLKFLVSESGCIPKALQNAENKLTRKETKLKDLYDILSTRINDKQTLAAISKYEKDAENLRYQINKVMELNKFVEADDVIL